MSRTQFLATSAAGPLIVMCEISPPFRMWSLFDLVGDETRVEPDCKKLIFVCKEVFSSALVTHNVATGDKRGLLNPSVKASV